MTRKRKGKQQTRAADSFPPHLGSSSDPSARDQHPHHTDSFGGDRPDLSSFDDGSALPSWLRLCPDNRVTGGKVLSVKTRKVKNRAATAHKLARIIYHMVTTGQAYDEAICARNEEQKSSPAGSQASQTGPCARIQVVALLQKFLRSRSGAQCANSPH
jgi:hypothetical protein